VHLAIVIGLAVWMASSAAMAQVEIVRPVPRGPGQHGFTIEVPTPGAYGSFEVLRGGRLPDAATNDEAIPVTQQAPASALRGIAPVQVAPVRPVEIVPVGPRSEGRAVRVQRGPFIRPGVQPGGQPPSGQPNAIESAMRALLAPEQGDGSAAGLPALPAGARVIRIR
jgi:hypothetical protein